MSEERGTGTKMSSQEENMKNKEIYLLEIAILQYFHCISAIFTRGKKQLTVDMISGGRSYSDLSLDRRQGQDIQSRRFL